MFESQAPQLQPSQDWLEEADRLKMTGRHKEAIALCHKMLLDDLECVEAYEEIGDNYLSLKEFEKAEKALERAVKLDPASANAHYLLGFAYSSLGEWDGSVHELEEADVL